MISTYSMYRSACLIVILLVTGISCRKDSNQDTAAGNVAFRFDHSVDGAPLVTDTLLYTNAAGNHYQVTDLMYFVSDITFYGHDGSTRTIGDVQDIFYIDIAMPATLEQHFSDPIPAGEYDSVSFVFGIREEKNISFIFPNPPEMHMAWPEILGGGYHYMMMNGKWLDTSGSLSPFNFHLGIGQLYRSNVINVDSIYAYVQNWFRVSLPGSSFILTEGETRTFTLTMNINSWFDTPGIYDHDHWGGAIMQNQPAMQMIKENGWNVFSLTSGK